MLSILISGVALADYTVSNVVATPIIPFGVKLTYDLDGIANDAHSLIVSAEDKTSGEKYIATPDALQGDLDNRIGSHTIAWNMAKDGIYLESANVVFKVYYGALYLVIDLSGGTSAKNYPISCLDGVPEGGWTDEYKTTKLVLRRINAGKMPRTDVNITLTKDYYIGVFEVTQKQYKLVTGSNPSYFSGDKRPVERVSYNTIRGSSNGSKWPVSNAVDASSFFGKLRARTGLTLDLPTEAQWEYACRAGSSGSYGLLSTGKEGTLSTMGWYDDNSGGTTHDVGWKTPNAWGLYDMHGNVWEWCLDWYASSGYSGTDPKGASSGSYRVLRGGGYRRDASDCTASLRKSSDPSIDYGSNGYGNFGIRIVCTLSK